MFSDIHPAIYDALLHEGIPGLTADRLDWLSQRASSDAELRDWLHPRHGREAIDVALRHGLMARGQRLHESDRIISGICVPNLAERSRRTRTGARLRIGSIELYDQDELTLLRDHDHDQELGKVLRSEQAGWGLRMWAEVVPGPVGDEALRAVGFGELGCSVGLSSERLTVEGDETVLILSGEVAEVSLTPLAMAALGPQTIVTRSPLPSRPKRATITTTAPPVARTAAASQMQTRTWPGLHLTVPQRR